MCTTPGAARLSLTRTAQNLRGIPVRIRGEYNTPSFTKADEPGGPIGTAFPVVRRIDISPDMKDLAR